MKRHCPYLLAGFLLPAALLAADPFAGRWDLTVKAGNTSYPDWLEVVDNGGSLQVRYQPRGGSVRPLKDSKIEGDHLLLTIQATGKQGATMWNLTAQGDRILGTQKVGDRETAQVSGVRAPKLDRPMPKK